jgi:hypothetical protein
MVELKLNMFLVQFKLLEDFLQRVKINMTVDGAMYSEFRRTHLSQLAINLYSNYESVVQLEQNITTHGDKRVYRVAFCIIASAFVCMQLTRS